MTTPQSPPRDDLLRASYPAMELRAAEGDAGMPTMVGHFARFNEWTKIDSAFEGTFMERMAPGAFARTLKNNRDSIRVLFQHGRDPQVGDKPLGPIADVREDDEGAYFEVPLLDTSYNRDLLPGLRANLYGSSFRFSVPDDPNKDVWNRKAGKSPHNPEGLPERTIREARLFEFGPVTFPAYSGATAGVRSITTADLDAAIVPHESTEALPDAGPEAEPHSDEGTRETVAPTIDPEPIREEIPVMEYNSREEKASRVTELKQELTRQATEYPGVLPSEAQVRWDADTEELETLERDIAAWDSRQARLADYAGDSRKVEPTYEPVNVIRTKAPADIWDKSNIWKEARSEEHRDQLYRDYAMRGVEIAKFAHPDADTDKSRDAIARLLDHADSPDKELARRIIDTGSPQYRAFFQNYLRTGQAERVGQLLVQTDAQGGYAIPFYMDPTLVKTGAWTPINPYRQACTVKQIVGTDTYMGATAAAVTIARAAEAAASVEGGPAIGTISKVVSKVHAMVTMSIEMLEDRPEIVSDMTGLIAEAKDTEEEAIFTLGAGDALGTSFNPTGMLAAHTVTAYCWTHGDTDVANTLDADDIFQHEALVPIRHRVNAAWFMGRATIRAIQALETANGQLFGQFYGNIGGGPVPGVPSGNTGLRLLGYPIYEVPSAVTGTAGDAVVAGFGDPKGFYIIDRVGMSLEVIPHLWAAAMLPTGTRGIYAWWRNTSLTPNVDSGRRLSIKA